MYLDSMPLRAKDYWIVAVASMEQLIGGALSTVISVMLPMMQLTLHPELPSLLQGIIGAMGLIGIGVGSFVIGAVSDRSGYLFTFRLCPVLMVIGSLICYFFTNVPCLIAGLFVIGIGVGGGYSLDSAYISELLPTRWREMMIGIAKATCSIGFMGAAVACVFIMRADPDPHTWPRMIFVIMTLAIVTLLMRLRWWESPKWLIARGEAAKAEAAAQSFLGKDVQIQDPADNSSSQTQPAPTKFRLKDNIPQVIFSGIPWACEGLAVYGFSVFLPVLVMALGIDHTETTGITRIIGSVEITAVVNFFMLPGFVIGLLLLQRVNNVKMLYTGFLLSAVGLLLLLAAYMLKWPVFWMLAGFFIFEVALNGGPHLLTFIIPARVYPVADRAEGNGIAALLGKIGAIVGVIVMPVLLHAGGVMLVLSVSAAVMVLGAAVGLIYGRKLKLT